MVVDKTLSSARESQDAAIVEVRHTSRVTTFPRSKEEASREGVGGTVRRLVRR
jgi:hypothetical protein